MQHTRTALAALVVASAVALAGCSSASDAGDGASDSAIRVGVVSASASNPAVQVMNAAVEAQAQADGVTALVETSESVDEQIQKAETLLAQGIDYLGIQPWDGAAVVPLVTEAAAQGVKVVILIDGVPDVVENGTALTYISGDEPTAAEKLGELVSADATGPTTAAIVTGTPGNLSAINRTDGFKAGLEGSDVTVVAESTANWARDEALTVTADILTANPGLGVLFANNDEMGLGAVNAINEAGLSGQVDVIGWNGTCEGLSALLTGAFVAEAVLPFDEFGSLFVQVAVADASGDTPEPRIAPEVPILTTADAQAILAGTQDASDALVTAIQAANAGC